LLLKSPNEIEFSVCYLHLTDDIATYAVLQYSARPFYWFVEDILTEKKTCQIDTDSLPDYFEGSEHQNLELHRSHQLQIDLTLKYIKLEGVLR